MTTALITDMIAVEVRAIVPIQLDLTTPSLSSSEDDIINLNISSSLIDLR